MATEPLPDDPALRAGRHARLLAAMEAHDLDLLVLGRVANIRYATGVPILWNAGSRPFGPGCVVVRETGALHLLSTWDEGVPDDLPREHLFGITWNPMNYVEVVKRIAAETAPRRVGTDAISPLFATLLPMALGDAELVDASPALREARRVKTAEEVGAIRTAIEVAESAMAAAIEDLRPGVTERELTAAFMDDMASRGITTPASQDVVRIATPRADGVRRDERVVEAGDLVSFHAGVVAGGYAGEVGRTVTVDVEAAPRGLADLLRRSAALWDHLLDACAPGAPGTALLDAYRAAGEALPTTPVGRGLGLGFDDPVIAGDLPATAARERLDPGVVLVVTGQVTDDALGAVVTHQPILITPGGPELLAHSPAWTPERTGAPR